MKQTGQQPPVSYHYTISNFAKKSATSTCAVHNVFCNQEDIVASFSKCHFRILTIVYMGCIVG